MPRAGGKDSSRRRCADACDQCKKRKERCSSTRPCERCVTRGVGADCAFSQSTPAFPAPVDAHKARANFHLSEDMVNTSDAETVIERIINPAQRPKRRRSKSPPPKGDQLSAVPHLSRLIRDAKGKFMFIGDSANLSFLQNVRRLVYSSIGTCDFVSDPLRHHMVETSPAENWVQSSSQGEPEKPGLTEATYLIRQYMYATTCVFDLYDESDLLEHLPLWLEATSEECGSNSPIYWLVLAVGAQTSYEDKDDIAEVYFNYGRYLTASQYMDDPSIATVQSYSLITFFMLGAARRNAAFMNLGIAVRAAYALGLHKREVSSLFPSDECRNRERVWKVLRILDLFMSASLGRPPSTSETRDTTAKEGYSASASLCQIFENILIDVYGKRIVSAKVVDKISAEHRLWTTRLNEGLAVDGIQPADEVADQIVPNIGLIHVKEAYYWTIMLLTRPFLVEQVALCVSSAKKAPKSARPNPSSSNNALAHACVDSALQTIELVKCLKSCERIPKRLPFVVNSVFISAIVLGLAFFSNFDHTFPLEKALNDAQVLLQRFGVHDAQAKRNSDIIDSLAQAAKQYVDRRDKLKTQSYSQQVMNIFGRLDNDMNKNSANTRAESTTEIGTLNGSVTKKQMHNEERRHAAGEGRSGISASYTHNSTGGSNLFSLAQQDHGEQDFADAPTNWSQFFDQPSWFSPASLWFDLTEQNLPDLSTAELDAIDGGPLSEPFPPIE